MSYRGNRRYNGPDLSSRLGNGRNDGDMEIENGGGGGGGNFQQRLNQNHYHSQDSQTRMVTVEVRGWQGGSRDDLVSFLQRKSQIRLRQVNVSGPVLSGQVPSKDAGPLSKWSGVRFAGNALKIDIVQDNESTDGLSTSSSTTNDTIQVLTMFLKSRYDKDSKLLNLQFLNADPILNQHGLLATPTVSSKMFPALMKVASQQKTDVESVVLANNSLTSVSAVTSLAQTFPDLKNLSLADNNLVDMAALEPWRHKFRKLRELVLTGNPITTLPEYKDSILRLFPRLILLDGIVVQDETQLDSLKLPLPIKQYFFENSDIQSIVGGFLTTYFELFDRDRSQLLGLYQMKSTFSLSLNSNSPRVLHQTSGGPLNWSVYLPISRNLQRITTNSARVNRLHVGPESIGQVFKRIPSTVHNIKDPQKFSTESWKVSGITQPSDTGVMVVVHGEFEEQQSHQKRSFDRSFLLLIPSLGTFIVVSDMLTVRAYGGFDSWQETVSQTPAQEQIQPPIATVAPPNALAELKPEQAVVVQQLMAQTGLNLTFATMCAQQANFDLAQAINLFHQSRSQNSIPPEAFN